MERADINREDWGLLDYGLALARLRALHARRVAGAASDTLVSVEHPLVVTMGRHARSENLIAGEAGLARRGIALHRVERGGDVTLHAPGQAVLYPVLALAGLGLGVRALVAALMEAARQVAAYYGLAAQADEQRPGLWVAGRKLASVGLAVRQGVSLHGLSFNVGPDLGNFGLIRACGLEAQATSLARELGMTPPLAAVSRRLAQSLGAILQLGSKGA